MAQVRVNPGDSLWRIAQANPVPGVTVTERIRQIASASGITDANKIKPGQMLTIPGGKDTPNPPPRPDPRKLAAARQTDTRGPIPRTNAAARPSPAAPAPQRRSLSPKTPAVTEGFKQSFDMASDMNRTREDNEFWMGDTRPQAGAPPAPATPMGNMGPDSGRMADMLMSGAGTADQVSGLPSDMNPAFPDSGAETPAADALAPSPTANVIGPQFTPETFAPTPSAGADPQLAALLADPIKRQQVIQALMQPGGGM
jgi:LysM repeat protein